jgi:hypothetical protein
MAAGVVAILFMSGFSETHGVRRGHVELIASQVSAIQLENGAAGCKQQGLGL